MKSQDKQNLLNQYIVIELENDFDVKFAITERSNFTWMNLCDTYDNYGQKVSEYDCGCENDDDNDDDEIIHTEVLAWNYWNGSNWRTLIIDCNFSINFEFKEANEETSIEILSEMPDTPYMDGASETIETENYNFIFTRWANDPWICSVR